MQSKRGIGLFSHRELPRPFEERAGERGDLIL